MVGRRTVVVATLWAVSLVGTALWAQGGQSGSRVPAPLIRAGEPVGEVITGENLGFQRVANPHDRPGQVTGRVMVRIDGVWKEAVSPMAIVR
jgi:hypothetical protein